MIKISSIPTMLTIVETQLAFRSPFVERLLILADYFVYDGSLLPHESVYDYPLPIINID